VTVVQLRTSWQQDVLFSLFKRENEQCAKSLTEKDRPNGFFIKNVFKQKLYKGKQS